MPLPNSRAPTPALAPEESVLWDVVEEHLDEVEFGFGQLDRMRMHPRLTLADLQKYPEARLLAHLDALEVAGDAVVDRLLLPALAEPDPEALGRVTGAACVLARLGRIDLAAPALAHELPAVRAAAARGLAHSRAEQVVPWAYERLSQAASDAERSGALELLAMLRAEPPLLLQWLQSDDASLVASAARATLRADVQRHSPVIEYLLEHPAQDVREAALVVATCWALPRAFKTCEQMALDSAAPSALATVLYALLGAPAQHERLAERVRAEPTRKLALFALGYSGNAALLPLLIEYLRSADALTSKLAAQAIATITDLDLNDETFARPPAAKDGPAEAQEAERALPELAHDDLDADLAPAPEDALELPNADAIARFCEQVAPQLDPKRRYLNGQPFGPDSVLDALERGPLRRRDALALALLVGTSAQVSIDTRAFSGEQRAQIAAARSRPVGSIRWRLG